MIPLSDQNLLRGLICHWLRLCGSKMLVETGRKLGCRVFDSLRVGGLRLFYQAPGSSCSLVSGVQLCQHTGYETTAYGGTTR